MPTDELRCVLHSGTPESIHVSVLISLLMFVGYFLQQTFKHCFINIFIESIALTIDAIAPGLPGLSSEDKARVAAEHFLLLVWLDDDIN